MSTNSQFDFTNDYVLEDERVILRPITITDTEHLEQYVINEPEIWQFSLVAIEKPEDLTGYIQTSIQGRNDKNAYPFIVFDKITNSYVGSTRFYDMQLGFETTQLGYTWYSKKVWGKGLNAHCKFLLLQFAFEKMN
jgi:RimJ/RimL family protein N-acetyltransferase